MQKYFVTYPLRLVYIGSFFFAINNALTSYINSSYLESLIGNDHVGFVYGVAAFISLIALSLLPYVLDKFGIYKTLLFSLGVSILSLVTVALTHNPITGIFMFIAYFALVNLVSYCSDILVEAYSKDSSTGRTRGLYLTFINVGWLLSPFFAGIMAEKGFSFVYGYAALLLIPFIAILIIGFRRFQDPTYSKPSVRATLSLVFKEKKLLVIFSINFLLNFFYAWMVVFTPLYLHEIKGIPWGTVGIIFTMMLLPFVLFDFAIGKIVDRFGEKYILMTGFLIMGFFTMRFGFSHFTSASSILIPASLLFMTRVGASMVETASESYFFKQINATESELIGLFRAMSPLAYMTGPAIATLLLFQVDMSLLYPILSIFLLAGAYISNEITTTQ